MSVDEVVADVESRGCDVVEVTGGEPLLQADVYPLMQRLLDRGKTVLIETGGHRSIADVPAGVIRIMDVKCPGSGMAERNDLALLRDLRAPDQLKFVLADRRDFGFARDVVRQHGPFPCPVFFNPVGGQDAKAITEWLLAETEPLPVHVGIQMHKLLWGDVPGR